jgi:tetratricopeptide (TPR) repeat protein
MGMAAAQVAVEKDSLRKKLKSRTEEGLKIYQEGDVLGAAQVWLEVLQMDPTFEEARAWLQLAGRKIKSAPSPAKAEAIPPSTVKRSSEKPAVAQPERAMELYKEGVIQYAQDNVSRAVALWKECLALDPSLARAREALRQAQAEMALQ